MNTQGSPFPSLHLCKQTAWAKASSSPPTGLSSILARLPQEHCCKGHMQTLGPKCPSGLWGVDSNGACHLVPFRWLCPPKAWAQPPGAHIPLKACHSQASSCT